MRFRATYDVLMGTEGRSFGGERQLTLIAVNREEAEKLARRIARQNQSFSRTEERFTNTMWTLRSVTRLKQRRRTRRKAVR